MHKKTIFLSLINICKKTLMPLACVVVFVTFYVLVLPAITVSNEAFCLKEEHTHGSDCFKTVIGCGLEIHEHDQSCYECQENHEHNESCPLVCTKMVHQHDESCNKQEQICLKEEHLHTLICFSDKNADIETKEDWETTIPELSGNQVENVINIAKNQLGYKESELNYEVIDEEIFGYTRYGQYFNKPYASWNSLFVRFVLDYSSINIYSHEDINIWHQKLSQYLTNEGQRGNLIFIDSNQDTYADLVGIVESIDDSTIKTIQGDIENQVSYVEYDINDSSILGYYSYLNNEITLSDHHELGEVQATFSQGVLDENIKIKVTYDTKDYSSYNPKVTSSKVFTISFEDIQGNQVEPHGKVSVKLSFDNPLEADQYSLWDLKYANNIRQDLDALIETNENNSVEEIIFEYSDNPIELIAQSTIVNSESDLRAIINTDSENVEIILGSNFNIANPIVVKDKNVSLDLNGYTLSSAGTAFAINTGTLTIKDSSNNEEKFVNANVENNYGNKAILSEDELTYYVTVPTIIDHTLGKTEEHVEKHTVSLSGKLYSSSKSAIIRVEKDGVFNLESGTITGGQDRAIYQTGGTVNLNGGYICNNTYDGNGAGGAIYTQDGTLNINGVVIAANYCQDGGAIHLASNSTLNINDGVISGNTATATQTSNEGGHHYGGGGIYASADDANPSVINMNGGYVTNNIAVVEGYFDGGGGFLVGSDITLNITGGFITGNKACSGGGIRTNWASDAKVYITKENFISSNYASSAEGGGVCINNGALCHVTAGYITNNITNTDQHWGGGGLFCANGSQLYILNVVVNNNDAGGFGGGVAGCSTGRVYICVKEGGAIFDNSAKGEKMAGDESAKSEDKLYALNNDVFMKNGYQDYFCALNSLVEGTMLGGGSANWDGSADGYHVSVGKGEVIEANYIMGLSSQPSDASKKDATDLAQVFITGNTSSTHGGGILANGYLIVGLPDEIKVGNRLEVHANKAFLDSQANKLSLDNNEFKFEIIDVNTKQVVSTGSCDEKGVIQFMERIPFNHAGSYSYYVQEVKGNDPSITYDTTQYKIDVTVDEEENKLVGGINGEIIKYHYYLSEVIVSRQNGEDWEVVKTITPNKNEVNAVSLDLTGDIAFTNYKLNKTNISVKKQWLSNNQLSNITVQLYRNGKIYHPDGNESGKVILSDENDWSYTWKDLLINENGLSYEYSVKEESLNNYMTSYEQYNQTSIAYYWVPTTTVEIGENYIMVNPNKTHVFFYGGAGVNNYDTGFTTHDKVELDKVEGPITINGITYDEYINNHSIDSKSILQAYEHKRGDVKGFYLKNNIVSSGLLVQNSNGNMLKGGTLMPDWVSLLQMNDGKLIGAEGQSADNFYTIIYDESAGKFNAVKDTEVNNNAVKLYKRIPGPPNNETVFVIKNTHKDDILYSLDITKKSNKGNDITLSGAVFNILDANENILYFNRISDGAYELSSKDNENATADLITGSRGKLYISLLHRGPYTIREIEAPKGYLLAEDVNVTLGSDNNISLQLEIIDKRDDEFTLPKTGGVGTYGYIASGLMLITLAILLYINKKYNCFKD